MLLFVPTQHHDAAELHTDVSKRKDPCHSIDSRIAMQLVPEELVRVYKRAMLNIHPALLPNFGGKGFYGSKVHQAVIKSGARFSGPTVHFVDEGCAAARL